MSREQPGQCGDLRPVRRGLGWLIDTRGHGGYVVAPGSVVDLPGGGTGQYEAVYDRPPAPLPDWITALLTAPAANPPWSAVRLPPVRSVT